MMVGPSHQLDELEFDAARPLDQRVRACFSLAEHAQRSAEEAPAEHALFYFRIAEEWLRLAEDMRSGQYHLRQPAA